MSDTFLLWAIVASSVVSVSSILGIAWLLKPGSAQWPSWAYKRYDLAVSQEFAQNMDDLTRRFNCSKAEALRLGCAMLFIADEGRLKGLKLTLSNDKDEVVKEILLPSPCAA